MTNRKMLWTFRICKVWWLPQTALDITFSLHARWSKIWKGAPGALQMNHHRSSLCALQYWMAFVASHGGSASTAEYIKNSPGERCPEGLVWTPQKMLIRETEPWKKAGRFFCLFGFWELGFNCKLILRLLSGQHISLFLNLTLIVIQVS